MSRSDVHVLTYERLRFLVNPASTLGSGTWPVLCFLHGRDRSEPAPIREAVTRHGPLAECSPDIASAHSIVVAPQLPSADDHWADYAHEVAEMVRQVHALHRGDPRRTYLTGLNTGGEGVFELAYVEPGLWAALWPVEPSHVPLARPGQPMWLSCRGVQADEAGLIEALALQPAGREPGDRVYEILAEDRASGPGRAYGDERVYRWLLSRRSQA